MPSGVLCRKIEREAGDAALSARPGFTRNGHGMSDTKDDKTLSVSGKKTLTLKRTGVEHGTVRQDMGRGRTKAVVVETRKRRISRPEDETKPNPVAAGIKPRQPAQPPAPPSDVMIQPDTGPPKMPEMGIAAMKSEIMRARR